MYAVAFPLVLIVLLLGFETNDSAIQPSALTI